MAWSAEKRRKYQREWAKRNPEKVKAYARKKYERNKDKMNESSREYRQRTGFKSVGAMHKIRFGGNRELALQRDNYSCAKCFMTSKEHKEKWGCELSVDHINNKGRYSEEKDHSLPNLVTLCLRCHGLKDGQIRKNREKVKLP